MWLLFPSLNHIRVDSCACVFRFYVLCCVLCSSSLSSSSSDLKSPARVHPLTAFLSSFWSVSTQSVVLSALQHNLASPSPDVRRLTVALFEQFPPQPYLPKPATTSSAAAAAASASSSSGGNVGTSSTLSGPCDVWSHAHAIAFTTASLEEEKNILRHVRHIERMVRSRQLPEPYVRMLPWFFLGM